MSETRHFICLARTEAGEFSYFRVFYAESWIDIIKYNSSTSIIVSYCDGISQSSIKQFCRMNTRFESNQENFFDVSHNFFMSYVNYLTKYKDIQKKQIWINPKYKIEHDNTEYFCGVNFDISSDDISVTTRAICEGVD